VASSGIATLLLDRGRTSHSCFKIPIPVYEDSIAGLKYNGYIFQVIQETAIIIWDKVPMQYKYAIDAIDQYLRDLLEVSINLDLVAAELICYLK